MVLTFHKLRKEIQVIVIRKMLVRVKRAANSAMKVVSDWILGTPNTHTATASSSFVRATRPIVVMSGRVETTSDCYTTSLRDNRPFTSLLWKF